MQSSIIEPLIRSGSHHKLFCLLLTAFLLQACEDVETKAKNTINKTGKTMGKGTTEFFKGVKEGIDKTLQCKIELSPGLTAQGIEAGKFYIGGSKGASDNMLTVYLIFEKNFNRKISVKLYDKNGKEYGRISQEVAGNTGEARYVDFVFDPRTDIEGKSLFRLQ